MESVQCQLTQRVLCKLVALWCFNMTLSFAKYAKYDIELSKKNEESRERWRQTVNSPWALSIIHSFHKHFCPGNNFSFLPTHGQISQSVLLNMVNVHCTVHQTPCTNILMVVWGHQQSKLFWQKPNLLWNKQIKKYF